LKYALASRNLVGQIHHEETLHRMQDINVASRMHPRTPRCFQSTPEIDAVRRIIVLPDSPAQYGGRTLCLRS